MIAKRVVSLGATVVLVASMVTTTSASAQSVPLASVMTGPLASLPAGPDDAYPQRAVTPFVNGLRYVAYERTYKGLPVLGGSFVVVTDAAGRTVDTSASGQQPITLPGITPKLTSDAAASIARAQLSTVDSASDTGLVVYAVGEPRLAWQSTVVGWGVAGPSRLTVVVDALTGAVLNSREHVAHGTGTSAWNGPNPVRLDTMGSGASFLMRDPTLINVSCQNSLNNTVLSGTDDLWGNGNPTNIETGCVDALFAAQTENRMLRTWLSRNSFNSSGGGWPLRVGLNANDLFYDGTQVQIGRSLQGQLLTSLDLVSHELGHGVDDFTPPFAGLSDPETREFIGDAFAAATEWFANEPAGFDSPDYFIGERLSMLGSGQPIRNMFDPETLDIPGCYLPNLPQELAAGIGDHWFYLVAEGSNPTNGQPPSPTCNHTVVPGVGLQTALRVLYGAMFMKQSMRPSKYPNYRNWTLRSAITNFPGSCTVFNTVLAAWNAVQVPLQSPDPVCVPVVSSPGSQTGSVGVGISGLQLSATGGTLPYVSWNATGLPPGLAIDPSTGRITGTPTAPGIFTVRAQVTDSANPPNIGSTTFTWTIGCARQLLANTSFESGNTIWTADLAVIGRAPPQPAHTGIWRAWLDGYGLVHTDNLSQTVTIPTGCTSTLRFYLHIDSAEPPGGPANDVLTVSLNGTTVAAYSNVNSPLPYLEQIVNLTPLAGGPSTLRFTGVGVCQTNGVSQVEGNYLRPAARRPSKAMSNALSAGFHRIVQRARPVPVGSKLMIAR